MSNRSGHEPLLIVTGAAGTGKTTVLHELAGTIAAIVLDYDVLWNEAFENADVDDVTYNDLWLRLYRHVSQNGFPVVLFGTGIGVPENVEPCEQRGHFSDVYYLALVCTNDEQRRRLRARPDWENTDDYWADTKRQVEFNDWFKREANDPDPFLSTIDTTNDAVEETAGKVASWIERRSEGRGTDRWRST